MPLNFGQLERRRADVGSVADNASRLARAVLLQKTVGVGEVKVTKALRFGIAFIGVPAFTSGYEVQTALVPLHFPMCTAFVWDWEMYRDGRLCIGAYIGMVVDDAGQGGQHNIIHHLHFEGVAVKTMPDLPT